MVLPEPGALEGIAAAPVGDKSLIWRIKVGIASRGKMVFFYTNLRDAA
jgi:hypothetical protein